MFHCLSDSAEADGNLAGAAGQLGKIVEHRNQSQPNPTQVSAHLAHPVDQSPESILCKAEENVMSRISGWRRREGRIIRQFFVVVFGCKKYHPFICGEHENCVTGEPSVW